MKKKNRAKPVVIVEDSSNSESDDDRNVIYIRKKKKDRSQDQKPQSHSNPPQPRVQHIINPFFSYNSGLAARNFTWFYGLHKYTCRALHEGKQET